MSPSKQEKLFPKIYAQELMRIALGDMQAAQLLAAANPSRKENIIYMAQQALEKGLKAVICHAGQPIPLVHDIGALIAKIPSSLPAPFGYELARLTEYASIRRYIEGPDILDDEEIRGTLTAVNEAIVWCQKVIQV
jgi:HEPN domain-containing protein